MSCEDVLSRRSVPERAIGIGARALTYYAFAQIDRLSAQMIRTGAPSNAVELLVVDAVGRIIPRPGAH